MSLNWSENDWPCKAIHSTWYSIPIVTHLKLLWRSLQTHCVFQRLLYRLRTMYFSSGHSWFLADFPGFFFFWLRLFSCTLGSSLLVTNERAFSIVGILESSKNLFSYATFTPRYEWVRCGPVWKRNLDSTKRNHLGGWGWGGGKGGGGEWHTGTPRVS